MITTAAVIVVLAVGITVLSVAVARRATVSAASPSSGATAATTPSQPSGTAPKQVAPGDLKGTVYYRATGPSGDALYARTAGQEPRLLMRSPGPMVVSPDLRRVAWTTVSGGPLDVPEKLMVSDIDGGNARTLADVTNAGGLCFTSVAWSPDSRRLIVKPDNGPDGPWAALDVTTGQRTDLDASTAKLCYPTSSPDGGALGWYDGSGGSGVVLTDAHGGNHRTVPHVDGLQAPCRLGVYAVAPDGGRALVSRPNPDNPSCGDGPGSTTGDGVIVDTATGRSLPLPITGGLTSGVFLPDGGILARTAQTGELVLLDPQLHIVARTPGPSTDDTMVLLAYTP